MHYTYTVKIPKSEAETSEEARDRATDVLNNNNFASSEGGYFSSSKADWFVIGGRSSGLFSEVMKGKEWEAVEAEAQKIIDAELTDAYKGSNAATLAINGHIGSSKLRAALEKLWQERLGVPFSRDSYDHGGYDDDAIVISPEFREALKEHTKGERKWLEEVEMFDEEEYSERMLKDLTEDDDGAWLVVVDYHN